MRELIINNAFILVSGIAGIELLLGILTCVIKSRRVTNIAERRMLVIICIGLVYDATVIAIGKFIGEGDLLNYLSIPRFLLSALMMPLLFPISAYAADITKKWLRVFWLLAILFMLLGLTHTFATILEPKEFAGLLRYAASDATPGWALGLSGGISAICVLPLIILGVVVIIKKHNIALLLSGIFMLGFTVLGPATGNSDLMVFLSMVGEAFMVFFIFLHCMTAREVD